MRTVVALGGNTLLSDGSGTADDQRRNAREAVEAVTGLAARELVFTHGNGPQVGALLDQQAAAPGHDLPLDALVAQTQGHLGYLLQQLLDARLPAPAATVVTQAQVDAADPAFDDPSKPVGPFLSAAEAADRPYETREVTRSDGSRAHRRVVPSPEPTRVVEAERVRTLVDAGTTVVAGGGGGVPVVDEDGELRGVEAVVDKDYTSALLASAVGARELLVLTDVAGAYLDFGGPDERLLPSLTPEEAREHVAAGEFGAGSMRPKVEACARFVAAGGDRAVITSAADVGAAVAGEAGTHVTPAG